MNSVVRDFENKRKQEKKKRPIKTNYTQVARAKEDSRVHLVWKRFHWLARWALSNDKRGRNKGRKTVTKRGKEDERGLLKEGDCILSDCKYPHRSRKKRPLVYL